MVAGPTCDSDDAYSHEEGLVPVPAALASGDPVWVLSCGAYATSYTTRERGGNGPTDLALLASALERAAREVSAAEVPSLL